ncbi:unnamed protein product [Vitrella brassicaformis CCMP3155]|uniref:Oocyst wall protein n=1 Tax=Vitrella brassicaformis (strain CCMP3155) TaxID=1169540 RepID=A0A0G4FDU8_VITBC|nr:unnamed protein product [Vitrella brassicaformis CCMP3155]|eukprot:CEM11353.1 unnamed protein product [Vitrella brassicaformis CCMP3155]
MMMKCGAVACVLALLAACVPLAAAQHCPIKEEPHPECPHGFMYDAGGGKCLKPFRHEPHYYCAEQGYVVEGNQCVLYQYADRIPYCRDPHATLSGTTCTTEETCPPDYRCRFGYHLTADGTKCYTKCPYTGRIQYAPRDPYCPRGVLDAHRHLCVITKTYPADFRCPFGYDPSGDKCVAKHFAERLHSCPDGLEFKRGGELPPVLGVGADEETCISSGHCGGHGHPYHLRRE